MTDDTTSSMPTHHREQLVSPGKADQAEVAGEPLEKKCTSASLSVIVPVYNEQFLVETSLERLEVLGESSLLERIQVIVVDDASSDGTPAALKRFRESRASQSLSLIHI